ncbi:MAG: hypothetical protein SGJ19_00165 [Planctomycetia bacterium]|nr:hypothetical protein [Planctomycetia bacterium]
MRISVQLEETLIQKLKLLALSEGVPLGQLVNRMLRGAVETGPEPNAPNSKRFEQRTFSMGRPKLPLDHANALAAALEDEEVIRKLAQGK